MKKNITSANASAAAANAYGVVYQNLVYLLYGLRTSFNVYRLTGANDTVFKCVTQFGEETSIKYSEGVWIDAATLQATGTSKLLGDAIDAHKAGR